MNTQFRTIQSAALADWGPAIETAVRRIAALVAFAYAAGYVLGCWVHRTNDRLSRAYVALLGLSEPVAVVTTPEPAPEPVACTLTVVELRRLARARGIKTAGGRRIAQATKSALMEALI